jgi:hypothetical protein
MFMPILISTAVGVGLIQLGALSVWVTVLTLIIKSLLLVVLAAVLFLLYRRHNRGEK